MKLSIFGPSKAIKEEKQKIEEFEKKISEKLDVAIVKDQEIDRLKGEKQRAIEGLQKENQNLRSKLKELENALFEEKKKKQTQIQSIVEDRTQLFDKVKAIEAEKQVSEGKLSETERLHSEAQDELESLKQEKIALEKEKKKLYDDLETARQRSQLTLDVQKEKLEEEKARAGEKISALNHRYVQLKQRYQESLTEEKQKARALIEEEKVKAKEEVEELVKIKKQTEESLLLEKRQAEDEAHKVRMLLEEEKVRTDQLLKNAEDYEHKASAELDAVMKEKAEVEAELKDLHNEQENLLDEKERIGGKLSKALEIVREQKQKARDDIAEQKHRFIEQMDTQKTKLREQIIEEKEKAKELIETLRRDTENKLRDVSQEKLKQDMALEEVNALKQKLLDDIRLEDEKRLELEKEMHELAIQKTHAEEERDATHSAKEIVEETLAKIEAEKEQSEQLRAQVEDRYNYILSQNHAITAEKKRVDEDLARLKAVKAKEFERESFIINKRLVEAEQIKKAAIERIKAADDAKLKAADELKSAQMAKKALQDSIVKEKETVKAEIAKERADAIKIRQAAFAEKQQAEKMLQDYKKKLAEEQMRLAQEKFKQAQEELKKASLGFGKDEA